MLTTFGVHCRISAALSGPMNPTGPENEFEHNLVFSPWCVHIAVMFFIGL